jgi:phosphatidylinositol glycan class T
MMRSLIFSLLIGAVMAVKAAAAEEEFREELTLHSLPDGKVAAHFSFSTLHGAVPRAPSSLGTDDTCTHISL